MGYCHWSVSAYPGGSRSAPLLKYFDIFIYLHTVLICFRLRAISTASSPLLPCDGEAKLILLCLMPLLLIFYKFMSSVWKKTTQQQTTPGLGDVPFSNPVPITREQLPMPLPMPVSDTRTVTVGDVASLATQAAPVMAPSKSDSFLEASSTKNIGKRSLCESFAWLCFFLFNQVYSFSFFHFNHCCGSKIRCFFDPWIRNLWSGMKRIRIREKSPGLFLRA